MRNRNVQLTQRHHSIFKYEKNKLNKLFLFILLITLCSQVFAFLFFGLVGKLEAEDLFLADFQTVFALASTLTMCILSILGTVFIKKKVVQFYIGNHRYRIFLFPIKRSNLFTIKMTAFLYILAIGSFGGMISSFLLSLCLNFLLQLNTASLLLLWFSGLAICLAVVILTIFIITFSAVIAIWRQSETTAIIASVLSILIVSNLFAVAAIGNPFVLLIIHLIIGLGCLQLILRFSKRIDKMDVKL